MSTVYTGVRLPSAFTGLLLSPAFTGFLLSSAFTGFLLSTAFTGVRESSAFTGVRESTACTGEATGEVQLLRPGAVGSVSCTALGEGCKRSLCGLRIWVTRSGGVAGAVCRL